MEQGKRKNNLLGQMLGLPQDAHINYTFNPYFKDKAAKIPSTSVEYISLRYKNQATEDLRKFASEEHHKEEVSKEILEFIKNDFKEACDKLAAFLDEALSE